MYKAIIFDFFGVFCTNLSLEWLKTTSPDYKEKLPEYLEICQQNDAGKITIDQFHEKLANLAGVDADDVIKGMQEAMIIDQNLVSLTRKLKKQYKIALLSNAQSETVLEILDEHKIRDLFDVIVVSSDIGIIKPDRNIFEHTISKLGCNIQESIFIDDSAINTQAAEKYGLRSIEYVDCPGLEIQLKSAEII